MVKLLKETNLETLGNDIFIEEMQRFSSSIEKANDLTKEEKEQSIFHHIIRTLLFQNICITYLGTDLFTIPPELEKYMIKNLNGLSDKITQELYKKFNITQKENNNEWE